MEITTSQAEGRVPVTVFHVKGKLDATTHAELEKQAQAAFESGTRNLVIDLSEVPYISSAGLKTLHRIFVMLRTDAAAESDEAMQRGIREGTFRSPHLKLVKPSHDVMEMLKTVGYDMYIDIRPSLKDAIAAF